MNVHNLMEEIVIERIKQLNAQIKEINPPWFISDCESYQMDAISYVLNRIPPKYVVSGRGLIHNADSIKDNQLFADIDALGIEGIRLVNTVPRKDQTNKKVDVKHATEPLFNFPIFTGAVFDGTTFEPLTGAIITLKRNGTNVDLHDQTWLNPCKTYQTTNGTYSFWVKSEKASKLEESKTFTFELEITAEGYDSINYAFSVPVVSDDTIKVSLNSTYSYKIQDLFLFSKEIENPME